MLDYPRSCYEKWLPVVQYNFDDYTPAYYLDKIAQYCYHHSVNDAIEYGYGMHSPTNEEQQPIVSSLSLLKMLQPYLERIEFVQLINQTHKIEYKFPIEYYRLSQDSDITLHSAITRKLHDYFVDILKTGYIKVFKLISEIKVSQRLDSGGCSDIIVYVTSMFELVPDEPYQGNFKKFMYDCQ